jgi:hypothetical protein
MDSINNSLNLVALYFLYSSLAMLSSKFTVDYFSCKIYYRE